MNNERMIAVSSDLIERAISLLDLLPESGTIIELRAALATQPAAGEPVHQVEFRGLDGGGWHDVDRETMELRKAEPKHWHARTLWTAPPAPAHGDEAVRDVLAERQRQVDVERFTLKNDDGYGWGALALAGGCYALHAHQADELYGNAPKSWPWASHWWKPGTPRRNLVKAAALILAEIQRLDRAAMRAQGDGEVQ